MEFLLCCCHLEENAGALLSWTIKHEFGQWMETTELNFDELDKIQDNHITNLTCEVNPAGDGTDFLNCRAIGKRNETFRQRKPDSTQTGENHPLVFMEDRYGHINGRNRLTRSPLLQDISVGPLGPPKQEKAQTTPKHQVLSFKYLRAHSRSLVAKLDPNRRYIEFEVLSIFDLSKSQKW